MALSKAEMVREYLKCKNDPYYFISTYVELELPGGNIKIKMYNKQRDFVESILNDHHVIALKTRQTGISTIVQAFICYVCTFFDNVTIGAVSKDSAESTDFCRKIMSMLNTLPDWLRPKYAKDTEQTFILRNGCKFYAQAVDAKNPQKLFRGKSVTIAIMDEAAHTQYIDQAWVGFGPALIKNQAVAKQNNVPFGTIVISTPNKCTGIGRWFFESWKEAHSGDSIYKPHKIYWKDIPEFLNDPNWYKDQCRILKNDQNLIDQELELKFISIEGAFFNPLTIEKLNSVFIKPLQKISLLGTHQLHVWEHYNPDKFYLIGIDTASSHGNDKSTVEVTDFETMCQVAEFQGKLRIDEFNKIIEKICIIYPNNLLIPEQNSYGEAVVEYFTSYDRDKKHNVYYDSRKYKYGDKKIVYGLPTTGKSRPLIIESLYSSVTENPEIIRSEKLALELISLEESIRGRIEASKDSHDDLAIAKALNLYVRTYDPTIKNKYSQRSENIFTNVDKVVDMNEDDEAYSYRTIASKYEEKNINEQNEEETIIPLEKKNYALRKYLKTHTAENMDERDLLDIVSPSYSNNLEDGDLTDIFE